MTCRFINLKKYFIEYYDIERLITEAEFDVIRAENALTGLKSVRYGEVKSTAQSSKAAMIERKDKLVKKVEDLKNKKEELYKKYSKMFDFLDDDRAKSIMRCYYLKHMTIQDIADMLDLSISQVKRLRASAVREFVERYDEPK